MSRYRFCLCAKNNLMLILRTCCKLETLDWSNVSRILFSQSATGLLVASRPLPLMLAALTYPHLGGRSINHFR